MSSRKKIVLPPKPDPRSEGATAPVRKKDHLTLLFLIGTVLLIAPLLAGWWFLYPGPADVAPFPPSVAPAAAQNEAAERIRTGVITKTISVEALLLSLNVKPSTVRHITEAEELEGLETIHSGHRYELLFTDNTRTTVRSLEYEWDEETYVTLEFRPYARVAIDRVPTTYRERVYSGLITENIWFDILETPELHHSLIPLLEEATKYTVDVFHLSPGDRFQLAYTEKIRNGRPVGVEDLRAVTIKTLSGENRTYRIYQWQVDGEAAYVNPDGISVRSRYLQAPVKFSIISSPYSKSRRHPVTGEIKPHKGTDFAAPEGAPIYALADGKVEKALFQINNGNNVRLIHDRRYKTQYLHMSEIAPGVVPGSSVKQGDIIGYVGHTGLATGPHVCLRFWEDEEQVDFLANTYVSDRPLPAEELSDFFLFRDELRARMESAPVLGAAAGAEFGK